MGKTLISEAYGKFKALIFSNLPKSIVVSVDAWLH